MSGVINVGASAPVDTLVSTGDSDLLVNLTTYAPVVAILGGIAVIAIWYRREPKTQ